MSHFRLSRLLPRFLRSDKDKKYSDKNGDGTCTVLFLDDTELPISVKISSKGQAVLDKVFQHLNLHEKDYFGLRYVDHGGQTHWLDSTKSISSQLKACSLPYTFYFGVKFYAADPCKLREEITRYLFFLQVKRDILQGRLPISFDEARELCAYALQSELGDYDPNRYTPGYISEFRFLPNQTEELEVELSSLHKRLVGQVPAIAEYRYLEKVKWLEMYGVDLHPVLGESSLEYFLGLTPTGIVVYKNKAKIGNYFWPRISKVTFKGKVFIIKVRDKNNDDHSYAFELQTKSACKHLWKCCVEHHAFFSGRTERQAQADQLTQSKSTSVIRVASRRQQRRVNSDSRLNDQSNQMKITDGGHVTMVMAPEPVRAPRHRSLPELQGGESPRSTRSAPWENNVDGGLYTSGKDSPVSARSDKMMFARHNRAVSGSDSESGVSNRRRYFPSSRKGSDGESDVSVPRRRRRDGLDSGSESDMSYRYALQNRRNRNNNDIDFNNQNDLPAMLFPFADKENRPNGSVPSLHSAPGGDLKQRRRRRRSKSPGNKRPPEELKQHFEYGLVDTDGMTEDQLKDIAFVSVETKAEPFRVRLSPRSRQRARVNRHRSFGETDHYSQKSGSKSDIQSVPGTTRHYNQSDLRTKSYTGLANQRQDKNLPPSGYGNYSNRYHDNQSGRSSQPNYHRGENSSQRNEERENSANSEHSRDVTQHNSYSCVNRRETGRQNSSVNIGQRDSSYRDNYDQQQSRPKDVHNGRRAYTADDRKDNLETSQHSNYSNQSVRDNSNRYGNSHPDIPDRNSYSNDRYNKSGANYNSDHDRSRNSAPTRPPRGDNYPLPNHHPTEYANPERSSHVRSSSQIQQQSSSSYNSRPRPQSEMYNSYPRNPTTNPNNNNNNNSHNLHGGTTLSPSPRNPRYNNLSHNNQSNYNPQDNNQSRYSSKLTNRSSYPTSFNHHSNNKPQRNPSSLGREAGSQVVSNGSISTDYQHPTPPRPYRQGNKSGTPPRNPSTPPRSSGYMAASSHTISSPAPSDQLVNRSLSSSINSEVMGHMIRTNRFNSDLCTEL